MGHIGSKKIHHRPCHLLRDAVKNGMFDPVALSEQGHRRKRRPAINGIIVHERRRVPSHMEILRHGVMV